MDQLPDDMIRALLPHLGPMECIVVAHLNRTFSRVTTDYIQAHLRRKPITRIHGYPGARSIEVFMPRHLDASWILWTLANAFVPFQFFQVPDDTVTFTNAGMTMDMIDPRLIFEYAELLGCARMDPNDPPHSTTVDAEYIGTGMSTQTCRRCARPRMRLVDPCLCFEWQLCNPARRVECYEECNDAVKVFVETLNATCCSRACVTEMLRDSDAGADVLKGHLVLFNPFECKMIISPSTYYHKFRRLYWSMGVSSMLTLCFFHLYIAELQQHVLEKSGKDERDEEDDKVKH